MRPEPARQSGPASPTLSSAATASEAAPSASGLFEYVVSLADDALIAAQRLGEWIASAPQLEEDVAVGNIALDLLGQARSLLTYAGQVEAAGGRPGRSEDDLAYFRDERDFRNVHLVERADQHDFAVAMARLLILATYQHALYTRLCASADETLAAVAAKAVKEVDYHRDHATSWVLRLGDGTEHSRARMQAAVDTEWRHVEELFDGRHIDEALLVDGIAVDPAELREPVTGYLAEVLVRATLRVPEVAPALGGGRSGVHTEQLGRLLAEMQHLARSHPGATW